MRSDDPSIPDEEGLYRRIPGKLVVTQGDGTARISSAAFNERNHEISIELASLTTPEEALSRGNEETAGVASVNAGQARGLAQAVVRDPWPENESHGLICGNQSKSVKRALAKCATWVLQGGGRT